MYDQKFPVVGEDLPVELSYDNVIFVMEDIDAQSPIVRCRQRAAEARRRRKRRQARAAMETSMIKASKVTGNAKRLADSTPKPEVGAGGWLLRS